MKKILRKSLVTTLAVLLISIFPISMDYPVFADSISSTPKMKNTLSIPTSLKNQSTLKNVNQNNKGLPKFNSNKLTKSSSNKNILFREKTKIGKVNVSKKSELSSNALTASDSTNENTNPNQAYIANIDSVYTGTINSQDEQRWYATQVTNPGKLTVYLQTVQNKNINYNIALFSLDQQTNKLNLVAESAYGPNMDQQLSAIASPGYYFLCVFSKQGFDQSNPYAFTIKYSDTYDSAEPDDNVLNCKSKQLPIQVSQTIDNSLDVDWIEFSLDSNQNIDINFQNPTNTSDAYAFDIFDSNLNPLTTSDKAGDHFYGINAGTYFIRVRSESGFDKSLPYNLTIKKILAVDTNNNNNILSENSDGTLNLNGKSVNLSWQRSYYLHVPEGEDTYGSYTYRSQSVQSLSTTQILDAVSVKNYHSDYTGTINHAFMVHVKHIMYTYWYTSYISDGDPKHTQHSQIDVTGQQTPRETDISSSNPDPGIWLVINEDTGTVVDLFSGLNFYYGTGIEKAPTYN